jgi:uncharacterized protein YndB with AHSA1/START domain
VTVRRIVRLSAIVLVAVVALVAGAVLVSAAVDEPSRTVRVSTTVAAREREVWRLLTDLDAYPRWNPTFVSADGTLNEGATLELRVRSPDGEVESREVSVLDVKPIHKLRWQERLLLPGVRDREVTIRVRSSRRGETVVTAAERVEGVLAPFADVDEERIDLKRMLAALRLQAEAS